MSSLSSIDAIKDFIKENKFVLLYFGGERDSKAI